MSHSKHEATHLPLVGAVVVLLLDGPAQLLYILGDVKSEQDSLPRTIVVLFVVRFLVFYCSLDHGPLTTCIVRGP